MERREIVGSVTEVAVQASEWLGCDISFILDSYAEGDFTRPRIFERLGQRHATLRVV